MFFHGSGNLIQTLLKYDLVDEFRLKIFPITLGLGKRLFAEGTLPAGLKLIESEISPNGVIVATYLRSGEVKIGSFALDIPTEAELARVGGLKKENCTRGMVPKDHSHRRNNQTFNRKKKEEKWLR